MPKVRGKVQLCTCDKYETCFKSFQGIEGTNYSLFDRYSDIENVVNRNIDEKYRHFLAQPEIDGDTVFWFSTPYRDEAPRRLTDLPDEERQKYEQIKNDTLNHYHNVVQSLKQQGENSEAECLEKAIKYVNDDFIYCYDGKTVLGIWGMQLRENIRESLGVIVKNATFKPPRPQEPSEPEPSAANPPPEPNEEKTEKTDIKDEPEKRFDVRFNAGRHGGLNGQSQYFKSAGDTVKAGEVPEVVPDEGYRFVGWDKEPINHIVAGDVEFTALYEEIPAREEAVITDETTSVGNGMGSGCGWLNWLLLPLLLALIFMVIWCCLLDKCNVCLCCGAHGNQTTVVVDDTLPPNHGPIPEPGPIPGTGDVQITLKWNNYNDLDLHCIDPSNTEIYYNRRTSPTGGQLDIDMNANGAFTRNAIENIYWPTGGAPAGRYQVKLTYYKQHDNINATSYTIRVKNGAEIKNFSGTIKYDDQTIPIYDFQFIKK